MTTLHDLSGIGLGTAQFAFREGSRAQSVATVLAGVDAGIRLIDTALAYTREGETSTAESIVHEALAQSPHRDEVLIATKGGHWREGDDFPIDASPAALRAHCDLSLAALGVDRLDLYQLHHVDPAVPLADSVGALDDLRREGKVAEIGLSNVSADQLDAALAIAPIATVQNRLSFDRLEDLPMAHRCAQLGLRYLAYLPLGGPETVVTTDDPRAAIAAGLGVSAQVLTLAWLRALSPAIVPLVGSSRPATIQDSARSASLELRQEDVAVLSAAASART